MKPEAVFKYNIDQGDGRWLYTKDGNAITSTPSTEIAFCFDKESGTLHKHGSPEGVKAWFKKTKRKFSEAGFADMTDEMVLFSGHSHPLLGNVSPGVTYLTEDDVNRCIECSGAILKLASRHENVIDVVAKVVLPAQGRTSIINDELGDIEEKLLLSASANEKYFTGYCHVFALALQEVSGLPLAAITDFDPSINRECLTHAFVQAEGGIIDIKGYRKVADVFNEFETHDAECSLIEKGLMIKLGEGTRYNKATLDKNFEAAMPLAKEVYALALRQIELEKELSVINMQNPPNTTFKVHDLTSFDIEDAYHATQTDENIKSGDILLVRDGVAVLDLAWPIMVTGESKVFHRLDDKTTWESLATDLTDKDRNFLNQVALIKSKSVDELRSLAVNSDKQGQSVADVTDVTPKNEVKQPKRSSGGCSMG